MRGLSLSPKELSSGANDQTKSSIVPTPTNFAKRCKSGLKKNFKGNFVFRKSRKKNFKTRIETEYSEPVQCEQHIVQSIASARHAASTESRFEDEFKLNEILQDDLVCLFENSNEYESMPPSVVRYRNFDKPQIPAYEKNSYNLGMVKLDPAYSTQAQI